MDRLAILAVVLLTAAAAAAQGRPGRADFGADIVVSPPPELFAPAPDGVAGVTALHLAAALGADPALIAALTAAGADPDARDAAGRTPLHGAATPQAAAALLAAGADPCALDAAGLPALSVALVVAAAAPDRSALAAALLACER